MLQDDVSFARKNELLAVAQRDLTRHGISHFPPITQPSINRKHVDGPYLNCLGGGMHWLTLWERLLTKLGIWNAWHIEDRIERGVTGFGANRSDRHD